MRSAGWPKIVAESLRELRDATPMPTAGWIDAEVGWAVAALRRARVPARSHRVPPPFLRPHQHDSWRRVTSALDIWRGALLLERVGTGKTWIALGVASGERHPALAIVPAILQTQWRDAARHAGVNLHTWTHERASRGRIPDWPASLVIIDEAHRFRNHGSRRVQTIAPWLTGRRVLLLTATPIVNRVADLVALLRLALPEDALVLDGIPRLGLLEELGSPPGALQRIAVRSPAMTNGMTQRCVLTMLPDALENQRGSVAVARIGLLALSTGATIRRLLASVFLDAASSSDAAFHEALKRYRALLLQSRDAGGASRGMLRQFAGDCLDQLVLWPLFGRDAATTDLPLADLPRVDEMLSAAPDDEPWIAGLLARCDDDRPTICFSRHRATALRLRHALGEATAWVTGSAAGIGPHRVAREAVLTAFGPLRRAWRVRRIPPRVLVATDVAAEGLDLHAAGRIVHVDLPWTATRIEQREGRLIRLGQEHPRVEVIVRMPATPIEEALAPHARVRRKHRLARAWLSAIESDGGDPNFRQPAPLVASVAPDGEPITLVGVRLERGDRSGTMFMVRQGDDAWHPDERIAAAVLGQLSRAEPAPMACSEAAADLAAAVRAAVTAVNATDLSAAPELVGRIHRLARIAAARRDGAAMGRLDRLLRFVVASPTLGARLIRARLATANDAQFLRAEVPDLPPGGAIQATVIAAVVCRTMRS